MKKIFARVIISSLLLGVFLFIPSHTTFAASSTHTFAQIVAQSAREELASVAAADASTSTSDSGVTSSSPNQDRFALSQPGLVRIVTHITGTSTVPAFDINLNTATFSLSANQRDAVPLPDDEYLTGTGFIVSPDGYIVTAAHVVSDAEIRADAASYIVQDAIQNKIDSLSDAQYAALEAKYPGTDAAQKFGNELALNGTKFLRDNMAPYTVTVSIAKPQNTAPGTIANNSAYDSGISNSSDAAINAQMEQVVQDSVPATVVSRDDTFLDDEKDVALLKVDETNLPVVHLGDPQLLTEGQSIYVFGYPDTSDYAGAFTTTPTYTSGTVTSLQDATLGAFKYVQIDAKIAPGSSGGPLFNDKNEVVGVIDESTQTDTSGDNFGFALPITLVDQMILDAKISTSTKTDYVSTVTAGIQLLNERHCKAALQDFATAEKVNAVFGDPKQFIDTYIASCNSLIASGQSLDNPWDTALDWVKAQSPLFWASVVGGILLIVLVIFGILYLMRRLRKEEELLHHMEEEVQHAQSPASAAVPLEPVVMPIMPIVPQPAVSSAMPLADMPQVMPVEVMPQDPTIQTPPTTPTR